MMKKNVVRIATVILAGLLLSGCANKNVEQTTGGETGQQAEVDDKTTGEQGTGKCQEEAVTIEGYGDKGKRLKNCFVEYPGEPSREDKSYYVVEDVCGQFTGEFIGNMLGRAITGIKSPENSSLYNCTYYLDGEESYVMLVFEYLQAEIQKKGQESMGRRVEVDEKIPMRNYVVWQEDGLLNTIYLILGDNKFISVKRSSGSGLTNEELINFAANIGEEIRNYK